MVGQVDPVQAALVDPGLELIGHGLRRAHDHIAHAADRAVAGDLLAGPLLGPVLHGERSEEGLDGLGLDVVQDLVLLERGQIQPGPAADDGLRGLQVGVALVLAVLGLGLLVGLIDHDGEHRVDLHIVPVTALGLDLVADPVGHVPGEVRAQGADEHGFGVLACEGLPARGGPGLEDQRRALRAGLGERRTRHREVLALVLDRVDLGRIGVDPALHVLHDGVVLPGALPQLVADVEELLGELVALVVLDLRGQALVLGGRGQVGGHHVEAHAPAGQMIQRRVLAGQRVRLLVGDRTGHAEAEVLGHRGHGGDLHERIVDRDLRAAGDRGGGRVAVDVVDADHIGQEQGVEAAPLEHLGQVRPVLDRVVLRGPRARVAPQPEALVIHAGHVEGVQGDPLGHRRLLLRRQTRAPCAAHAAANLRVQRVRAPYLPHAV